jgi:Arc/MetJ family transcription regulator
MATNLKLNEQLLETVLRLSGKSSKKAAVTAALEEFVQKREQLKALKLFGSIEYDQAYNYKYQRAHK